MKKSIYIKPMKKLILALLAIAFLNCEQTPNIIPDATVITQPIPISDPILITPAPTTPAAPTTPTQPAPIRKTAALKTATALKFFDGVNLSDYTTNPVQFSGFRQLSINDILTNFDEFGQPTTSYQLPIIPEQITTYGNSIWTFQTTGTQTNIWLNYNIYATPNYIVQRVYKSMLNDVIIKDQNGALRDITGQLLNIQYISESGFVIHNFDVINHTATIRINAGYHVTFSTNYIIQAINWQHSSTLDRWFSANGYTFDTVNGLRENVTTLWQFNLYPNLIPNLWLENPVLINMAVRLENSESVLYWLECNTGKIIRYVPSINSVTVYGSLYVGDGLKSTGQQLRDSLKLVTVGDDVYFNYAGNIWKFNFVSGQVVNFYIGSGEVKGW